MNPVFWLMVIVVLVCVWFAAAPAFKELGEIIMDALESAKEEMTDDESEDN